MRLLILLLLLSACKLDDKKINGYAEADYTYITSTSPGILQKLNVAAGDKIKAGKKLFNIKQVQLIAQESRAKAMIAEINASLEFAKKELTRAETLSQKKAISEKAFDQIKKSFKSHSAKLLAAKQELIIAQQKLKESEPSAENDGLIEATFFEPGEFINTGQPVLSIYNPEKLKLRFFVAQSKLPEFKLQQKIYVTCDGCNNRIPAFISFISSKAEFTPPVIFSNESRKKLVFMIEARPMNTQHQLHPGLPISIELN